MISTGARQSSASAASPEMLKINQMRLSGWMPIVLAVKAPIGPASSVALAGLSRLLSGSCLEGTAGCVRKKLILW